MPVAVVIVAVITATSVVVVNVVVVKENMRKSVAVLFYAHSFS